MSLILDRRKYKFHLLSHADINYHCDRNGVLSYFEKSYIAKFYNDWNCYLYIKLYHYIFSTSILNNVNKRIKWKLLFSIWIWCFSIWKPERRALPLSAQTLATHQYEFTIRHRYECQYMIVNVHVYSKMILASGWLARKIRGFLPFRNAELRQQRLIRCGGMAVL